MARLERTFNGDKWQLFAAAYEAAIEGGGWLRSVDQERATFTYTHSGRLGFSLLSGSQEVEVAVSRYDDVSCVVFVETSARYLGTPQAFDWGEGRRIATRLLDGLEERWAQPLRAMEDPNWFTVSDSGERRWWDGHNWTHFVWDRDTAHLDHPGDAPPAMRSPKRLLGTRRWRLRLARDAVVLGALIALLVVLIISR